MTAPTLGRKVQLVVTVIAELPVAEPFGTRVKFTKPGVAVMETPSLRVAFRLTVPRFELACAPASLGARTKRIAAIAKQETHHGRRLALRESIVGRWFNFF